MRVRIVAVAILIILIAMLLSPVMQLGHATSGSMEQTISTDSLYIVNTLEDTPEQGDIVMYESSDQGRVTHRVIEVTQGGRYITKGDANQVPDQTGNGDALPRKQVLGVIPTVFGRPLVIPGSASLVTFVKTNLTVAILSLSLLCGAGFISSTNRGSVREVRQIFLPIILVAFIASVVFLSIGVSSTVEFMGVDGSPDENPKFVPADEESIQTLRLSSDAPPVYSRAVSVSGDLRVVGAEEYANRTEILVHVPALPDGTVERGNITVNYYPPVLPSGLLSKLHQLHPLAASIVTTSICYFPVYLVYLALIDPRKQLRPYLTRGGT